LSKITSLPAYVEDVIFDQLADQDYDGDVVARVIAGSDNLKSDQKIIPMGSLLHAMESAYDLLIPYCKLFKFGMETKIYQLMNRNNVKKYLSKKLFGAIGSAAGAAYRNADTIEATAYKAGALTALAGAAKFAPQSKKKRLRNKSESLSAGAATTAPMNVMTFAPASKGYSTLTGSPSINTNGRVYRVRHRELVNGSLAGSTSFSNAVTFRINPGLASSFPWVSAIAGQYEQWHGKCSFTYVPVAPTSAQGDIIMFCDYNVYDAAPTTEQQAIDHVGCVTAPIWTMSKMVASTRDMFPTGPRKYIRGGNVLGDKRLYDGGVFYLFTNNCASSSTIGKLLVEYEFEFSVPQLDPPVGNPSVVSNYQIPSVSQTFTSGTPSLLGGWTAVNDGLGLGAFTIGTGTNLSLPVGCYKIDLVGSFQNTTSELTLAILAYVLGGVSSSLSGKNSAVVTSSGVGGALQVSLSQVITVPTATTFQVNAECVFATGPVSSLPATWELTFTQV